MGKSIASADRPGFNPHLIGGEGPARLFLTTQCAFSHETMPGSTEHSGQ